MTEFSQQFKYWVSYKDGQFFHIFINFEATIDTLAERPKIQILLSSQGCPAMSNMQSSEQTTQHVHLLYIYMYIYRLNFHAAPMIFYKTGDEIQSAGFFTLRLQNHQQSSFFRSVIIFFQEGAGVISLSVRVDNDVRHKKPS